MNNPAIVVVTYNRPESLKRLLGSLNHGIYEINNIPFIISVDYEDSDENKEVRKISNDFHWAHGEKRVIEHISNLGLRKHVISCGHLTQTYDSIIMLEDDLYVSPHFYSYGRKMLLNYDYDKIAGISLYNHKKNPNNQRPFVPAYNGKDVFFVQYAQSWGQCWSKNMWSEFIKWYDKNEKWDNSRVEIPDFVSNWPNSSWLKYFINYAICKDKFFVYPYYSLSTNFNDLGTHNKTVTNSSLQVPLNALYSSFRNLPSFSEGVKYDAFFERIDGFFFEEGIHPRDLCIDLYDTKEDGKDKRYFLTTKILNYKILKSYGLTLKPHELNVHLNNPGTEIFLYDTNYLCVNKIKSNRQKIKEYDYALPTKDLLTLLLIKIQRRLLRIIK